VSARASGIGSISISIFRLEVDTIRPTAAAVDVDKWIGRNKLKV